MHHASRIRRLSLPAELASRRPALPASLLTMALKTLGYVQELNFKIRLEGYRALVLTDSVPEGGL